jgi:hypothetical protein
MHNVCENEACRFSFCSAKGRQARELVGIIRGRMERGEAIGELTARLTPALEVFQTTNDCRECGNPLLRLTQPTTNLTGDDLARAVEKNNLLISGHELQALGILPFD